jgi:hypothetical protein
MKTDQQEWKKLYEAAILEADHAKLPRLLREAKAAIDTRLHDLLLDHGGTREERLAISDALRGLNALREKVEIRLAHTEATS